MTSKFAFWFGLILTIGVALILVGLPIYDTGKEHIVVLPEEDDLSLASDILLAIFTCFAVGVAAGLIWSRTKPADINSELECLRMRCRRQEAVIDLLQANLADRTKHSPRIG